MAAGRIVVREEEDRIAPGNSTPALRRTVQRERRKSVAPWVAKTLQASYSSKMSLTLEISTELEPLLKAEAARAGRDVVAVAHEMLARSLRVAQTDSTRRLPEDESQLLEEINQGPSTAETERYLELIRKRQDEAITAAEVAELRAFTERMEKRAATRMQSVARLAERRGVEVETLMKQLQLDPPDAL